MTSGTKTKSKKQTLVLLDAHAILHRAYHALPDFTAPSGEPTGALYGVIAMLLRIIEEFQPDHIAACFDLPEPTYRHTAYEGYKATRTKTDDALVKQIERSRDIFKVFGIKIYEAPGFEADDMLGTIVEQTAGNKDLNVIIASGDMDTLQLIDKKRVTVYTLKKGIKDTVCYDEAGVKARYGFGPDLVPDYKGLRGDPSDNIPGIAGIGEKTATELITRFGGIEAIYKKLAKSDKPFLDAGIKPRIVGLLRENEEEAQFSKMLATIRRDAPCDFALPEKSWKENADTEAMLSLFSELGFRTLATRIRTLFALADVEAETVPNEVEKDALITAGLMLWLVESDRTNPTYEDILDYGRSCYGTTDFVEITKKLEAEIERQGLTRVFTEIDLPLLAVIEYMNDMGVRLDTGYLAELSKTFHKELRALEKKIHAYAGREFNVNSPRQLGDVLYDTLGLKPKQQKKTATGQRSTRESELEKMKGEHPIIEDILRYRELSKLTGTYIDNLPAMVAKDGRLRTTFLPAGTTTGRVGSKDPNLQNIPIKSEEGRAVRKAFVAAKGYELVSIDYSQIDLRMAAILSNDAHLVEIFKHGEDVHSGVASRVFNVPEDEVTKEMRRRAKVINFGILYGMGVNALRTNLGEGATREEAQEFLNAYFNTFTRLAEYLEETKAFARTHGYTETLFGRKRHFPGITSNAPFIRASAERMAINAPIQGTAADVMRVAMNELYAHLKKHKLLDDARMILQVHDEIVFEVKKDLVATIVPKLIGIMEGVLEGEETNGVPLRVAASVGKNWAELKEFKAKS